MKNIVITVISILILTLVVFVAVYDSAINKCILRINGEEYTVDDFNEFLTLMEITQGTNVDAKEAYEQYWYTKLYLQKAKENNLTLTEEEIKSVEESYISENFDEEKLAKLGVTKEKYLNYYKDRYLALNFMDKMGEYYPMTGAQYAEEIKKYDAYLKTYNYRVLQVTPKTEEVSDGEDVPTVSEEETKAATKARIEEAIAKINGGEDFETVAKEYGTYRFAMTLDGNYTLYNGELESIPLLYLANYVSNEQLYSELITMEPGNFTTVVEENGAFVAIKLESVDEGLNEAGEKKLSKDLNVAYAGQYILANTEIVKDVSKAKNNALEVIPTDLKKPQSNDATQTENGENTDNTEETLDETENQNNVAE